MLNAEQAAQNTAFSSLIFIRLPLLRISDSSSSDATMADNADSQVIHAPVLDWSTTPLANVYAGHYVKIIDDLFTPEECAALIKLAESDAEWQQAAVHYGIGMDKSYVDTEYRNSERILRFDDAAAEQLYQKMPP